MLQKAKSTLLKLLICVCVICCMVGVLLTATACNKNTEPTIVSVEIVNGELVVTWSDGHTDTYALGTTQQPEPGKPGDPGQPGVGIKSIVMNDKGQLIITLEDGTVLPPIDLPMIGNDICVVTGKEHNIVEVHKIAEANCITGEIWFVACMDCEANAIRTIGDVDASNHLHLDDTETIAVTCTQDGHEIVKCLDCGAVVTDEVTTALGHQGPTEADGAVWTFVADDNRTLCEHGGTKLLVCERCLINGDEISEENENLFDKVIAPAAGHDIGDGTGWKITKEPTMSEGGILSGPCHTENGCGSANAEIELPPLTDARWSTTDGGTCKETSDKLATRTWTITVQGKEFSFVSTSAKLHYYEATDTYYTGALDDPKAEYEWAEGLLPFANSSFDCSTLGYAHFICSACGDDILIRVWGVHAKGELIAEESTAPTCEEDGENVYECTNNPEHRVREKAPATGHAYEFKDVTGKAPDLTIIEECANCGDRKETKATSVIKNEAESVDATCDAAGKIVYDYTYTDAEGKEQTGKFESTVGQLDHHFADFYLTKGVTPTDGSIVYEMSEMSEAAKLLLKGFANVPVDCSTVGGMHIICEGCSRDLLIFVRGEHKYGEGVKTPATCTEAGKITYTCEKNEEHLKKVEVDPEAPEALGHNYKATLSADKKSVHLECTRCGDTQDVALDLTKEGTNGTGIEHKDADCSNQGYDRYWYIDPATKESKYVESTIEKVAEHTLKSKVATLADLRVDTNNSKGYTIGAFVSRDSSIKFFANTPGDCTEAGALYIHCSVCDKDILILNVKGDHKWDTSVEGADSEGWVTTPASCGVAGSKTRKCSVCDEVETVAGEPAVEHNWVVSETVEPTLENAGKIVRTCTKCATEETIDLPALNETDYTKTTVTEASCIAEGVDSYEYKKDPSLKYTASTPKTDHKLGTTIIWIEGTTEYTGHYCLTCKQTIVESTRELDPSEIPEQPEQPGDEEEEPGEEEPELEGFVAISEPVEGDYIIAMYQANLGEGGEYIYLTGEMDGYYFATSNNVADAAVVTIAKSGDGYVITVNGKYVEIEVSGTYKNVKFNDAQTEGKVWSWNEDYGIFTWDIDGEEYYLGTYSNYKTLSANGLFRIEDPSVIGVTQFVAYVGTYHE